MARTVLTGTRDTLALLRRLVQCRPSLPVHLLPDLKKWQKGEFWGIPVPDDAMPGDWICFCEPGPANNRHLRVDDDASCDDCGATAPKGGE